MVALWLLQGMSHDSRTARLLHKRGRIFLLCLPDTKVQQQPNPHNRSWLLLSSMQRHQLQLQGRAGQGQAPGLRLSDAAHLEGGHGVRIHHAVQTWVGPC